VIIILSLSNCNLFTLADSYLTAAISDFAVISAIKASTSTFSPSTSTCLIFNSASNVETYSAASTSFVKPFAKRITYSS